MESQAAAIAGSEVPTGGNGYGVERVLEAIHSGDQILGKMGSLCETLTLYAPPPTSVRHPSKALPAIDAQINWLMNSHMRTILDHNDSVRRHLLQAVRTAGMHSKEISFPDNQRGRRGQDATVEMRVMKLEDLINWAFNDVRHHTLTHLNLSERTFSYYARIWVSGGEIPMFPLDNYSKGAAAQSDSPPAE